VACDVHRRGRSGDVALPVRVRATVSRIFMSIAKVTEVKSSSTKSFDDALNQGLARASQTVKNIKGAWISEQDVLVENDKITEYRVLLKITFVVE
jgi:hypothetical protein